MANCAGTDKKELVITIRWLIRRDLPCVLEIENKSFEFPWSSDDFIRRLRQRNCVGMVAECDGRIVGFLIYEIGKKFYDLLNFAVHPDFRRCGVGGQLIQRVIFKMEESRSRSILRYYISATVRETNLAAQFFLKNLGFQAVNFLRGYYKDSGEDAYLMEFFYKKEKSEIKEDAEERYCVT